MNKLTSSTFPGLAVRHDADGDAVLHLRHRRHADVRQHRAQPQHRHRETQQLQTHRTSFHDAFQVRINIWTWLLLPVLSKNLTKRHDLYCGMFERTFML